MHRVRTTICTLAIVLCELALASRPVSANTIVGLVVDDVANGCAEDGLPCHEDGDFVIHYDIECPSNLPESAPSDRTYNNHAYWSFAIAPDAIGWCANTEARWYAYLPSGGRYKVQAFIPQVATGYAHTSAARYTVFASDGEHAVIVDQAANTDRWVDLGVFEFAASLLDSVPSDVVHSARVVLTPRTSDAAADRTVLFDAVRWCPETCCAPAPVEVRSFLDGYPDGAHFREGEQVRYCYTASREVHINWSWWNPTNGWQGVFDGAGQLRECRTSAALSGTGLRRIRVIASEDGTVLASPETHFYVDAACRDDAALVPPAPIMVEPGARFDWSFVLSNTGTCDWDRSGAFRLAHVAGSIGVGEAHALPAVVTPGGSTTLTLRFTAPAQEGSYTSQWQMSHDGRGFGPIVSAVVDVRRATSSISGTVVDGHGHRLPYIKVELLDQANNVLREGQGTDERGTFTFRDVPLGATYRVRVALVDSRSRSRQFCWGSWDNCRSDAFLTISTRTPISVQGGSTTRVDLDFAQAGNALTASGPTGIDPSLFDDLALMFYHVGVFDAFEREVLGLTLQPVDYIIAPRDSFAACLPAICIDFVYAKGSDSDGKAGFVSISRRALERTGEWRTRDPRDALWHELSHHLMAANLWAVGSDTVDSEAGAWNHGGYCNPSTRDSWQEGWAHFWPGVVRDVLREPDPELYPPDIDLEVNKMPWSGLAICREGMRGGDEEDAVAGLLWDLHDDFSLHDDDTIDVDLATLWRVVGTRPERVYNVRTLYLALQAAVDAGELRNDDGAAVSLADVDASFIAHGLYSDADGSRTWQSGEHVGYVGDRARPYRLSQLRYPWAYLQANVLDSSGVPTTADVRVHVRRASAQREYVYETRVDGTGFVYLPYPGEAEDVSYAVTARFPSGTSNAMRFDGEVWTRSLQRAARVGADHAASAEFRPGAAHNPTRIVDVFVPFAARRGIFPADRR